MRESSNQSSNPRCESIEHLFSQLWVAAPGFRGDVEGVVCINEAFERGALAQPRDDGLKLTGIGEHVPRSLEEKQRDADLEEVGCTLTRWLSGGVQRESQKSDAADARQWRCRLRLRNHAAPERLAAGDQGDVGRKPRRFGDCRAHRSVRNYGRIRPPRSTLHVRKLETQRPP